MTGLSIQSIYEFSLMQIAAESYFEDTSRLASLAYLKDQLRLGTNRTGYNYDQRPDLGSDDLNEGWPGLTRMTTPQIDEFVQKFEVIHQWSDNPCLVDGVLTRPAIDYDHNAGLLLNSQQMLANTGFSATLIRDLRTGEYTLSIRSTESRGWADGGDAERDMTATDALGVVPTGFALAQLDALEKYYQWLKDNCLLPQGAVLNVTGYSLGGHLATVFTEMHQADPYLGRLGNTVTFNGAGRGTWNGSVGSEADFLAYYRSVLNDPASSGLNLPDCSDDSLKCALGWATAAGFFSRADCIIALANDFGQESPAGLLADLQADAGGMAGRAFSDLSLYDDKRYGWAVVATILKFGLALQLPGTGHGTLADDHITQVFGFETIVNVNMTANSQNNGPERRVGIESQPVISGLGGFSPSLFGFELSLPGDYGYSHSIDLLTDSLALQRCVVYLDHEFNTDRMIELLPFASSMSVDNFRNTNYEADALENILDSLRLAVLGTTVERTGFKEGGGGYGDWEKRDLFHANLRALENDPVFQSLRGQVSIQLSQGGAGAAAEAKTSFASFLSLFTLSPVCIKALPGCEAVVDQALAVANPDLFEKWQAGGDEDGQDVFTSLWFADRAQLMSLQLTGNRLNARREDGAISLLAAEGVDHGSEFEDIERHLRIRVSATELLAEYGDSPLPRIVFGGGGRNTLDGSRERDRLYGMAADDVLDGKEGDDYLEGGEGIDTYRWRSGDGNDHIFDVDEDENAIGGRLEINGQQISTVIRSDAGVYEAADCIFLRIPTPDGEEVLVVRSKSGDGGLRVVSYDRDTNTFGIDWSEQIEHGGPGLHGANTGLSAVFRPLFRDPLALDLDGDGIETVGIVDGNAVLFDHDGDGVRTGTGWLRPDDGWLVMDRSGNGRIDNGGELFGIDTVLQDGTRAADGFAALREWDGNGDGVVSAADAAFGALGIWRDLNQDGLTQAGELQGLAAQGIVSIGVQGTPGVVSLDGGNVQTTAGVFTRSNGSTGSTVQLDSLAANLNLLGNTFYRHYSEPVIVSAAAGALPQVTGSGRVRDLREAASLAPDFLAVMQDYLRETTRDGQQSRLDAVMSAWAATSDFGSLQRQFAELQAQGSPAVLSYSLQGYTPGTAEHVEMLRRIGVVECFMGFTYAGNGVLTAKVAPDSGDMTVGLVTAQLDAISGAYDAFRNDVYNAMLLQTRLKPYVDAIRFKADEAAVADFTGLVARFDQAIAGDARAGVLDLVEFIGAYGADTLQALGWSPLPYLSRQLSRVPELDGFAATLGLGQQLHVAAAAENVVSGGAGNDVLMAAASGSYIVGQDGNDALTGRGGNDVLSGGAGADSLYGGAGDDVLEGGSGSNTYLYRAGEGRDAVQRVAYGEAFSRVLLQGADPGAVSAMREGHDIVFRVAGQTGALVLQNFVSPESGWAYTGLSEIVFDDGTSWSFDDVLERVKDLPTSGSDLLYGLMRDDRLAGLDGDDILTGWGGNDLLQGDAGRDRLDGGEGNDVVLGGDGDDSVRGNAGDDVLVGGRGNDILYGDAGADTFIFERGDGQDSLGTWSSDNVNDLRGDTVRLGYKAGEIVFTRDGETLFVTFQNSSDRITVSQYFAYDGAWPAAGVTFASADGVAYDYASVRYGLLHGSDGSDRITGFAAADNLNGGAGNDILIGAEGDDRLDGGSGADTLALDAGDDTFVLAFGGGMDEIKTVSGVDLSAGVGHDTIEVVDFDPGRIRAARIDANRIGLNLIGTDDAIIFSLLNPGVADLTISFADGTRWTSQYLQSLTALTENADYFSLLDTDDSLSLLGGDDEVRARGGNDVIDGGAGNDVIDGGTGNDRLQGGDGDDTLNGDDGDDNLSGGAGGDVLRGGTGADALVGGAGVDVMEGGDGNDTLDAYVADGAVDTLQGGAGNDQYRLGEALDRIVEAENGGYDFAMLDFAGAFAMPEHLEALFLDQADGNYQITGNAGANLINASRSRGANSFAGGAGDDEYYYVTANDQVIELAGGGIDTVYAAMDSYAPDANIENVTLIAPNEFGWMAPVWNLYGNGLDNIFLNRSGYAANLYGYGGNDTITGGDSNEVIDGGSGNNVLVGGGGNDTLVAGGTQDVLTGGSGNDVLRLGAGQACVVFESAWGKDTLYAGAGNFSLDFKKAPWSGLTLAVTANGSYRIAQAGQGSLEFALPALDKLATITTTDGTLTGAEWLDWLRRNPGHYANESLRGPEVLAVSGARYRIDSVDGEFLVGAVDAGGASLGPFSVAYRSPLDGALLTADGRLCIAAAAGITAFTLPGVGLQIGTSDADDFAAATGMGQSWWAGGNGADVYALAAGVGRVYVDVTADDGVVDVVELGSTALAAERLSRNGDDLVLDAGAADSLTVRNYFGNLANPPVLRTLNGERFSRDALALLMFGATVGDDVIIGSAGDDVLFGWRGNDELNGLAGNDILEGGEGRDRLLGGSGDDVYLLRDTQDVVVELAGQGSDVVRSWVDVAGFDNVEEIRLEGAANLAASGRSGSDRLIGNIGNNRLDGGSGADYLQGGAGNDIYVVDDNTVQFASGGVTYFGDTVIEQAGEGSDTVESSVTFTLAANLENLTLTGGAAINGSGNELDNVLRGNAAANVLSGGLGNDSYYVGAGDSIVEAGQRAGGIDTVFSDVSFTLADSVENLVLNNMPGALSAVGNAGDNRLVGNAFANTLNGCSGADVMEGGDGNDDYVMDTIGDSIVELAGQGIDTVQASVSYTLAQNVENLTLTGSNAIDGNGNDLDNLLTGNSAANRLAGGKGNDSYVVTAKDIVVEAAGEGIDTVQSATTWTLGANLENLVLTGTAKINGTGNELDNRLVGNAAANAFKGGKGNDTYVVGAGDGIGENLNEGIDTVEASVAWTLGANLENLTLTGSAAINGTGNTLANRLRGNAGNNTLTGGAGNDTYLFGRGGAADTLVDSDSTAGNADLLLLDAGVKLDQLWFRHVGSALEISIIGTADKVSVSNWYGGASNRIERIQVADGHYLLDSKVEQLVQAMAGMASPSLGQSELTTAQHQQLDGVLAASWQTA